MDERLMMVWYENIWFHKSLMVMDAFKVHFTDDVAAATLIGHTVFVKVPTA